MKSLNKKYLVVEGNIGSGKSSLARLIHQQFDTRLVLEVFEDNPFLPRFYNDRARYAFTLELSFMAERFNQLKQEFDTGDLFYPTTISDYHFLKSLIFAGCTLADDEYRLYRQIFDIIYDMTPKPDLYLYLHRPVEVLLKQITQRGREYEKSIDADYLLSIQSGYFQFFKEHPELSVLLLDVDDMDYVNDKSVYNKMVELICRDYTKGISRINLKSLLV